MWFISQMLEKYIKRWNHNFLISTSAFLYHNVTFWHYSIVIKAKLLKLEYKRVFGFFPQFSSKKTKRFVIWFSIDQVAINHNEIILKSITSEKRNKLNHNNQSNTIVFLTIKIINKFFWMNNRLDSDIIYIHMSS